VKVYSKEESVLYSVQHNLVRQEELLRINHDLRLDLNNTTSNNQWLRTIHNKGDSIISPTHL
jgi:hypothetical protein